MKGEGEGRGIAGVNDMSLVRTLSVSETTFARICFNVARALRRPVRR